MKRIIFCLLIVFCTVGMMATVAYAADTSTSSGEYLTWGFLKTMAGAVAATTLFVQFLKLPFDKVWEIPTRFLVYAIALFILLAVELFSGTLTAERAVLMILNAVIVATAAMGTYESTFKKLKAKVQT